MIRVTDLVNVLKNDINFSRLLENAKESDVMSNLGFDSLDYMLICHMIEQEYKVKIEVLGMDSLKNIVDRVNDSI